MKKINECSNTTSKSRPRRRNRQYISVKKKGKLTKIGNKRKCKFLFLSVFETAVALRPLLYDVASISKTAYTSSMSPKFKYDSDSFQKGIDNHASSIISNQADHFILDVIPTKNTYLREVGGNLKVHREGMLIWKINDGHGKTHELAIKNALYVPNLPICLLSP